MEIRIAIFLSFAFVSIATNTLLIWFMYKAFAGITLRVTESLSEFEKSSSTRQWIDSLATAAQQAASVTEAAKQRIADFEPELGRAQENFNRALVKADSKLEEVAEGIDGGAIRIRNLVAQPAFSMMAFAAGLRKVLDD